MALGSWQGLYNAVIDQLMDERREQELLLLMAIARNADRLGFAFPGRAKLMARRRISQPVYERRLTFLEERCLVRVEESFDHRRRQTQFDFQISPRALYVREEFQQYCEQVFDGEIDRNYALEKWLLENHFRTNDSQPEVVPESEPDSVNQTQEPNGGTRHSNQRGSAETQKGRKVSTMRNGKQRDSAKQPTADDATAHSKDNPQAGGRDPDPSEFDKLLSPTVGDDQLADEIRFAVATTSHQARDIVETYQRDHIVHWLKHTAVRRAKGELSNPGGYFYRMVKKHALLLIDESELP
jgi:hypothetical protein